MRVSVDRNDDDYWMNHFRSCPEILLDGRRVSDCIIADDEKGIIVCECRDTNGNLVIDYASQSFVTLTVSGKVEIVAPLIGESVN